ncbi:C45 family autoproteolytic acyltransferase/hydrolase [Amycolatopsis cynarae]|uniref:C45 family autoproteolytic acyltransferase/hydrolase n=1 Tax=Amycolatopsis cynarae TaxID=2995223 RepID=A0ABY7B8F9_9PSEU|nr:C45 family peptidase [Amycolatopsis sp. HUAS 11-8]WAL68642.1 C45 family autoproteolytic acyltransferase/hydrolase [Amycolatopsis sp. HUAS 11-8]
MTFPFVRLRGDAFERGWVHGKALSRRLRAFLDDGLCRLDALLDEPVTLDQLRTTLANYRAAIETGTPRLAEEIRGLAAGAGITEDEATLLQVRREILGYQRVPTLGDCTTYARSAGLEPVLAQTVDLNGDLDEYLAVLDVSAGPRRALVLSFGGLLGYLGVNDAGLAVGLNLVLGGDWRPGLPPYLAIRHLLDTAGSVGEAVEVLRGLRLASSRSLTLCDAKTTAWVEVLGDEMSVSEGPESFHTNHFLHPGFTGHDELNVFARNFSRLRLKTCQAGVAELPRDATTEDHFALLSTAPIRVEGTGDLRRERTVAAVVLWPGRGELHVRAGDPAVSPTRSFALT